MLSMCIRPEGRAHLAVRGFRLVVRIAPAQTSFYEVSLKNERKSRRYSVTVPNCGHGCPQSGRACAVDRAEGKFPVGYSSFRANAIRLSSGILVSWLRAPLVLWPCPDR